LIGLILIVLEGSLELELNRSKVGLIKKSSIGAFLPLVLAFRLRIYYNIMEDILLGQPNKCDSFFCDQ
jgi:hypothetical protein